MDLAPASRRILSNDLEPHRGSLGSRIRLGSFFYVQLLSFIRIGPNFQPLLAAIYIFTSNRVEISLRNSVILALTIAELETPLKLANQVAFRMVTSSSPEMTFLRGR